MVDYVLSPPFRREPDTIRNGTPFVGQSTVDDEQVVLTNDGFFPDVSLTEFRARRMIDDTHATERLVDALQAAMMQVNAELSSFAEKYMAVGFKSLAQIPAPKLGSSNTKILAYLRAVFSTAQAMLNQRYWAVSDTVGKKLDAAALAESADEYQRERWEALQLLRGEPRTLSGAL